MSEAEPHYRFPLRALDLWRERDLEVLAVDGLVHTYRFVVTGSTCNNGGEEFDIHLYLELESELPDAKISRCWIEIPEESLEVAGRMCGAGGDAEALASSEYLDEAAPRAGVRLSELLGSSERTNPAGCICYREMVAHKWQMMVETLHRSLVVTNARGEPS